MDGEVTSALFPLFDAIIATEPYPPRSELASRLDVELALLCGAAYESALAATADSVRRMSARLDSMSGLRLPHQLSAAAVRPAPERLGSAFRPKSNRGWAAEGNF